MCLQDVAIATRYRGAPLVLNGAAGATIQVAGGEALWTLVLLPTVINQAFVLTFRIGSDIVPVTVTPEIGSGMPITLDRATMGTLFDNPFTVTGGGGTPAIVTANYLDPDVQRAAMELDFNAR